MTDGQAMDISLSLLFGICSTSGTTYQPAPQKSAEPGLVGNSGVVINFRGTSGVQ